MFHIIIGCEKIDVKPNLEEAFIAYYNKIMEMTREHRMSHQFLESCWIEGTILGITRPIFLPELVEISNDSGWVKNGKLM